MSEGVALADGTNEFQIGVFGSGGVGKSQLSNRFTNEEPFNPEYVPTIYSRFETKLNVDGKEVDINVLDTAGQEEFAVIVV